MEGSVPLWEAILGRHKGVMELLVENHADLSLGDVGLYACTAAEKNNMEIIEDIAMLGGDMTLPRKIDGSTAMHLAVSEGNAQLVSLLLEYGVSPDVKDGNGWTPKTLADQQGHDDIKTLFANPPVKKKIANVKAIDAQTSPKTPRKQVGRFRSEPSLTGSQTVNDVGTPSGDERTYSQRRKTNNFHNSLFGIVSAAGATEGDDYGPCNVRVTVSCPAKPDITRKLILLPGSIGELLRVGSSKFQTCPTRVLTKQGSEVDDIQVIRDGDELLLVDNHYDSSQSLGAKEKTVK